MNVVGQQMPLLDPALSVFRKLAEHLPQVIAQLGTLRRNFEMKTTWYLHPASSDLGSQIRPS